MINPSIAVIVVNWNSYKFTFECISSLKKCNYSNFKIILVDNGSKDFSIEQLRKDFKGLDIIKNKSNLGFTGGNNIAISKALKENFDYVMLLNNDTKVNSDFLSFLVERLENENNLGAIQPLILQMDDKNKVWNAGGEFIKLFGLPKVIDKGKNIKSINPNKHYTEWISGCCIMLKSKVINEVGLLDNSFFAYFEDVDWSLRIKNDGYLLGIDNRSIIYHYESGSSKTSSKSREGFLNPVVHYYNFRNHIKLIKKHRNYFNITITIIFQVIKIISFSFYFIVRLRFNKLNKMWHGVIDGINS
jgi:GT2 family glycosyltransferase